MARRTFFVIDVPKGSNAASWGKRYGRLFDFDFDVRAARREGQRALFAWPRDSAGRLRTILEAARVQFSEVEMDPDELFGITGD